MKIKFNLIALSLLLSFIACKKDETTSVPNLGDFTLKGTKHSSSNAFLVSGGPEKTGYYYDLVLGSPNVNHDNIRDDLKGNGDAVVIGLVSSSATEMAPGTYLFTASGYDIWDMPVVSVYINYNFTEYKGENYSSDIKDGGKMVVSKNGEIYEITYSGIVDGEKLEAHYKGSLQVF